MEKVRRSISERINARLQESPGEIFKRGKWRFWFWFVLALGALNSLLTALIFAGAFGAVALAMGIGLLWIVVGALHYSDSDDPRLARVVSVLDSISLIFVVAHFCFVLWVYGHLLTLRSADAKYEAATLAYNQKQEAIQAGNVKISSDAVKIAEANVKAKRLENDTAYWTAKAGLRVRGARNQGSGEGQFPALQTAPIELEKPKAPEESAAAFLARWDAWIRMANFGELILAAITLIYIRNRSAKFNAQGVPEGVLPVATVSHRGLAASAALRQAYAQKATPVATDERKPGLDALRAHLKAISAGLPGRWFKADLIEGGVSIRMSKRVKGREVELAKTHQSNKILAAVNRPDFEERLRAELIACGFPIGKGGE